MTKTLQQVIEQKNEQGEKAFIPYIMAGDGGLTHTKETIRYLQQLGATAIEVGIPFSDPVADGPVIEKAGLRALAEGTNLHAILAMLEEIKEDVQTPLILMTYLNPLVHFGLQDFVKAATKANVKGLIIPDMPLEERDLIQPFLEGTDIALVQLVSLTSSKMRIQEIAEAAEGFIYAVTVNGTTGEQRDFQDYVMQHLKEIKSSVSLPVLAGFGISNRQTAEKMSEGIDGVIVGSAIVDALHRKDYDTIEQFFQKEPVETNL